MKEIHEHDPRIHVCHFIEAIDPKIFGDSTLIQKPLETYLSEICDSVKRDEQDRIYTHGQKDVEAYSKRMIEGIPFKEITIEETEDLQTT